MNTYKMLKECTGFQWEKHEVSPSESEQAFFNTPLIVAKDVKYSQKEEGFYALGKTDLDRRLFFAFTIRKKLIRVISSRDMTKRERRIYEKREKEKNSSIRE